MHWHDALKGISYSKKSVIFSSLSLMRQGRSSLHISSFELNTQCLNFETLIPHMSGNFTSYFVPKWGRSGVMNGEGVRILIAQIIIALVNSKILVIYHNQPTGKQAYISRTLTIC